LAMAAGLATLRTLTPALHDRIARRTSTLVEGMRTIASRCGVPFSAGAAGTMFGLFFRDQAPRSFAEARTADTERFKKAFHYALDHGVYFAPSAFEAAFMSAAHGDDEIAETLSVFEAAVK
jgi:glutamate-1-semialdehyde 2,1-aminomutase